MQKQHDSHQAPQEEQKILIWKVVRQGASLPQIIHSMHRESIQDIRVGRHQTQDIWRMLNEPKICR